MATGYDARVIRALERPGFAIEAAERTPAGRTLSTSPATKIEHDVERLPAEPDSEGGDDPGRYG